MTAKGLSEPVRTALVGCGKVGHTHAQAFKSLPGSNFVAVCDASLERAEAFASAYGVRAYSSLEELLAKSEAGLLSVCTPHPLHAGQISTAARQGVNVLTEKPLAPDLQGCDEAIEACQQSGVKLGVISQRRLYPPVVRIREAIQQGKIGAPILATLTVMGWRSADYYLMDSWRGKWLSEGGGVLVNQTVHQLDVFQWLMGPIDELYGYWDNFNHPTIEVEDTAIAVVRFKSGAIGQILLSNSMKPGFYGKIHVHGANGASVGAQTEGGSPFVAGVSTVIEPPFNDIWTVPEEEDLLPGWQGQDRRLAETVDTMSYYHAMQIQDMLAAIQEHRPPMVTGEEGRKSVEIFTAIYRSQRDHLPVRFPLEPERDRDDYDGRMTHPLFSKQSS